MATCPYLLMRHRAQAPGEPAAVTAPATAAAAVHRLTLAMYLRQLHADARCQRLSLLGKMIHTTFSALVAAADHAAYTLVGAAAARTLRRGAGLMLQGMSSLFVPECMRREYLVAVS